MLTTVAVASAVAVSNHVVAVVFATAVVALIFCLLTILTDITPLVV